MAAHGSEISNLLLKDLKKLKKILQYESKKMI